MEKLEPPQQAKPHIEALRELIRTGAMAFPALEYSPLTKLKVVLQRCEPNANASKRAYVFIKVLQQVVKQRLEGKDAQTAEILFALGDYAGMPAQDRYRAVAKLHNSHWTWENYRKEPLTRHLLAVYLALVREAELTPSPPHFGKTPRAGGSGLVGQDWVMERVEATYNLPQKEGDPLESMITRRLRAISDGVSLWKHDVHIRERGIPAVTHATLFSPGELIITDTHVDKATNLRIHVAEVRFPKSYSYGETVEFTILQRVDVKLDHVIASKGWDWYGLIAVKSPVEYASVGVRFPPGKLPKHIWRYEDIMSGLVRPGKPTKESQLNADASGFVSCSWYDLSASYSYGIALDW